MDQSLVTVETTWDGEGRYRLLEPIRQYAAERLARGTSGLGEAAAGARHVAFYLALAETAGAGLWGPDVAVWLERLEAERDNLRAAFAGALAEGDAASALRLVAALRRFWLYRGPYREGETWAAAALAAGADAPPALRAGGLLVAAHLAGDRGDNAAAEAQAQESRALAASAGDRRGQAEALRLLGLLAQQRNDPAETRARLGASFVLFRELGNRAGAAGALGGLAVRQARDGRAGPARALSARALALARAAGQPHEFAWCLRLAGLAARLLGT